MRAHRTENWRNQQILTLKRKWGGVAEVHRPPSAMARALGVGY